MTPLPPPPPAPASLLTMDRYLTTCIYWFPDEIEHNDCRSEFLLRMFASCGGSHSCSEYSHPVTAPVPGEILPDGTRLPRGIAMHIWSINRIHAIECFSPDLRRGHRHAAVIVGNQFQVAADSTSIKYVRATCEIRATLTFTIRTTRLLVGHCDLMPRAPLHVSSLLFVNKSPGIGIRRYQPWLRFCHFA